MDLLIISKDMKDKDGNVLLKSDTSYMPKGEETINNKQYLVYQSEIKHLEVLIPL